MTMPASLRSLVETVAAEAGREELPEPPYASLPDQSADAWLRDIDRARREHNALALRRRAALDARMPEGLVPALLGEPGVLPEPEAIVFPVHTGAQLEDISPDLRGLTPRGPRPGCPAPAAEVTLSVYRDDELPAAAPCVLLLHGGAFWMGGGLSAVLDRTLISCLIRRLGAVVIDVDYRLAPEHPFPAPIIDTLMSLDLVRSRAAELGVDPARIAVVGTSSGGSVAVTSARADALRGGHPPVAALGLVVPSVDLTAGPFRADPQVWSGRLRQIRAYLGDALSLEDSWASPSRADSLPAMPPVFAAIAEYDEVARGAQDLCDTIVASGGDAECRSYPMTHTIAPPEVEAQTVRDLCDFLARALQPSHVEHPAGTSSP